MTAYLPRTVAAFLALSVANLLWMATLAPTAL